MVVALLTVNVDGLPGPKLTAVAPVSAVPVIATTAPFGPVLGPIPVTLGLGGET